MSGVPARRLRGLAPCCTAVLVLYSLFSSAVILRTVVPNLGLKHGLDWSAASREGQASSATSRRQLYEQRREAAMEAPDANSSDR